MSRFVVRRSLPSFFGAMGLALMAGCGGRESGPGTSSGAAPGTSPTSAKSADAASVPAPQPVAIVTVVGDIAACPAGFAHPNVCCHASPVQGTTCTEAAAPFAPCDASASTSPDPTKCCSLAGEGTSCVEPSASTPAPPADAGSACQSLCGPGTYPPPSLDAGGFASCADVPDGEACVFCCGANGCPSNQCGCTVTTDPEACACDLGCDACPAGWSTPPGKPDLCCRTLSGATQCYSQASNVEPLLGGDGCTTDVDAGTCSCTRTTGDGQVYAVTCDSSRSPACTCTVDGVTTKTVATADCPPPIVLVMPPAPPTFPVDPGMELYSECGFPSP